MFNLFRKTPAEAVTAIKLLSEIQNRCEVEIGLLHLSLEEFERKYYLQLPLFPAGENPEVRKRTNSHSYSLGCSRINLYFSEMKRFINKSRFVLPSKTTEQGIEVKEWVYGSLLITIGDDLASGSLHSVPTQIHHGRVVEDETYKLLGGKTLNSSGAMVLDLWDWLLNDAFKAKCRYENENGVQHMTEVYIASQKNCMRQDIKDADSRF